MELVTGALGSLLPKLGELLKEEYGLQKGVKKKIQELSRELTVVHAVLEKIGDVPPDQLDKLVRLWASEVREASYDMEDIVDTHLVCVDDTDEPTEPNILRRLRKKAVRLFKKSKARRNISTRIQDINEKLEEVAARRGRYTLDNIVANPVAANTIIDPRILNLYKRARELVGIKGPRDELIHMLSPVEDVSDDVQMSDDVGVSDDVQMSDDVGVSDDVQMLDDVGVPDNKQTKIVSIVGFGGLGKTTLAKAVYDHLKPHFKFCAFVPVGQNPDIKKVLRDILMALDENTYTYYKLDGLDENQLIGKLSEFIKEKRYLIVIDDIWDKKSWDFVKCALQEESQCGSRLLITTRISEVATCASEQPYKMKPLSDADSKELLYARIVDGERKDLGSPSVEACEKILKKCGGVPLAIITIASLLASKPGEDWSEIYNSIGFGDKGNDDVYNTRKILSFSYYDLPSHLKPCLLYLYIFPEEHVIDKNSLIWKWVAEGFISKDNAAKERVGLFELGERYFNELINRNMIQAEEREYKGYVNACSVHDMVLDLIRQLSIEHNFVTVLNGGGEGQKLQGIISRRLALKCVKEHNVSQLADVTVEKVRSIFASNCDFCALCPHLPFLRVVEMEGCLAFKEDCKKDVSDRLWCLLHLRYLRLKSVTELPREVRYLKFLQTLDLWENEIKELPEEVGLLTQLVCLRLRAEQKTRVPAGVIGKLTSLQELVICCSEGEDATMQSLKELGQLRELRVLKIRMDVKSESSMTVLLESLRHLHNIQELQISCSLSPLENVRVSDAGRLSCGHLRFLHLECLLFCGLPPWIKSSLTPSLSYLDVTVVAVKDQDIEILAKLPELSCLILNSCDTESVVGIKIPTDEGVAYFRKLRFFRVHGPSIWFDLCGSECNSSRVAPSNTSIMPSLESLEFDVHVRSLKDEKMQIGFDKMLGFQNVGTSSLQRVTAQVDCEDARVWEVEEAEAALKHAATVHPKHPTLVSHRKEAPSMRTSIELATAATRSLLHKLDQLLNEEYGLQKDIESVKREHATLCNIVYIMHHLTPDVVNMVGMWVRVQACTVREMSYHMMNMVDKSLQTRNNVALLRDMLNPLSTLSRNLASRAWLVSGSRDTLDRIVTNPVAASNTIDLDPRLFNLYKRANTLVGIERPRDELMNMLSLGDDQASDSKKMKIVSIVGFGGLGKTTLAKAVYDHLIRRFKYRAFVTVGRNPDIKKVFRDILIALDEKTYTHPKLMGLDENQLMCKLNEFIKEKRCFFVIDDIWDKKSWILIKCALQETNYGSGLVITTRISKVATYVGGAYKMRPLSHENSKKLLYTRILDGEGKHFDSTSAEACEKILNKCGGVPLTIITIGSLLASKPRQDWSKVYNSIDYVHKGNDAVDNTRKILSFSYCDLPSYLKPCLLYLSIFPKDHVIEKNTLIWMWMAEGFIDEEQATAAGVGTFDLGERYFNELINRSMIEPKEMMYEGYVDACSVHDMVLDLIYWSASSENFVTIFDGTEQQQKLPPVRSAHRLSLQGVEQHNGGQIMTGAFVRQVRTLFATHHQACDFGASFPRLSLLRVVNMECYHLRSFHHLKYLRLTHSLSTEVLRVVRFSKFLQTLDLRFCLGLEELPEDVGLLTQLLCLRVGALKVPAGLIGKLTSLQELCMTCPADEMQFVKELGMLKELRVLWTYISVMNECLQRGLLESLGNLHNVKKLYIEGSCSLDKKDDAERLVSCHHLQFLCLDCFVFSGLAAWINRSVSPNLSYLDVKVADVREQDMEALSRLRVLCCLRLHSRGDTKLVSIKVPIEGVVYFGMLRFLSISGTSIWFDLHNTQCSSSSSRVPSSNTMIMPSLESLEFEVHVRSMKDATLLIGFENLGKGSLQRVAAMVNCEDASNWEVEEAEAALEHAATGHPKHPTLRTTRRQQEDMLSCYQEARAV